MKIARFLILAAMVGIFTTVALADTVPVDPKLLTQGCGGTGQPACDAAVLTANHESLPIALTFQNVGGQEVASVDVINDTGMNLSTFTLSFAVNPGLSYSSSDGCVAGGLFTCTPDFEGTITSGFATFTLSGASLCSTNKDDWLFGDVGGSLFGESFFIGDHDADDKCQWGMILSLIGVPGDTIMNGETVNGTISAPEPSSALLLLFGLSASLLAFKKFSLN